ISEPEFVSFLQSLHLHRFKFNSGESALDTFGFADRFLMYNISKRVLPYLKRNSLSEELLDHALTVVDGVSNNQEILTWILTQFPSKSKLLEILHHKISNDSISKDAALMCVEASLKGVRELEESAKHGYVDIEGEISTKPIYYAYLRLMCFDDRRERVVMEERAPLAIIRSSHYNAALRENVEHAEVDFWSGIPVEYVTVVMNGVTYSRNRNETVRVEAAAVEIELEAKAYRN
ncbi:hypothetical protein PFISCL1PPCAC_25528, partial [Pristionchus fissidentatus]